ncbi:unnamed protein product, partial [Ectocarpus sp. 12 AP-2014]
MRNLQISSQYCQEESFALVILASQCGTHVRQSRKESRWLVVWTPLSFGTHLNTHSTCAKQVFFACLGLCFRDAQYCTTTDAGNVRLLSTSTNHRLLRPLQRVCPDVRAHRKSLPTLCKLTVL